MEPKRYPVAPIGEEGVEVVYFELTPEEQEKYKERVWANVNIGKRTDCWPWRNTEHTGKYGRLKISMRSNNKEYSVFLPRIVWTMYYGIKIPRGLEISQCCHNPPCVNPVHLSASPTFVNYIEAVIRGKHIIKKGFMREECNKTSTIKDRQQVIIDWLNHEPVFEDTREKYRIASQTARNYLRYFFNEKIDRSWLPKYLLSRYDHCKSYKEVVLTRKQYEPKVYLADSVRPLSFQQPVAGVSG